LSRLGSGFGDVLNGKGLGAGEAGDHQGFHEESLAGEIGVRSEGRIRKS